MRGLYETCVICSADDNAQVTYFKEFLKWTGYSYFIYIYNDMHEELNNTLEERSTNLDFIIYVNRSGRNWRERFGRLAQIHVDVQVGEIWEKDAETGEMHLCEKYLKEAWSDVLQEWKNKKAGQEKTEQMTEQMKEVFHELIEVYCRRDVLRKLINNKYSLYMTESKPDKKEYQSQMEEWESTIKELEDFKENRVAQSQKYGLEYLEHALCYCYRKVNELCNLLERRRKYETKDILKWLDDIYIYDYNFYMADNLKSKIASLDLNYKTVAIPYLLNCTTECKVDVCNSFHYYRLGKRYELIDRKEEAAKVYRISYQQNRLNFRALFKLAVDRFRKHDWNGTCQYLWGILDILQLNIKDCGSFREELKRLPPLELEYVSKCCVLLGNIERDKYGNNENALYYYKKAMDVHDSVDGNTYLMKMYPIAEERRNLQKHLKENLTNESIEKKIGELSNIYF